MREFVARFGCPLEFHTDQRRNFESELFKEIVVNCWRLVRQGPQDTDHLLIATLNAIID